MIGLTHDAVLVIVSEFDHPIVRGQRPDKAHLPPGALGARDNFGGGFLLFEYPVEGLFSTHASEVNLAVLAKSVIVFDRHIFFLPRVRIPTYFEPIPHVTLQINLWYTAWLGGHHVQQKGWGSNASRHGAE